MADRGNAHGRTTARPSPLAGRSSRLITVLALVAALEVAAGAAVIVVRSGSPAAFAGPSSANPPGPRGGSNVGVAQLSPLGVELPTIGVSSALVGLNVEDDGTLATPKDFGVAGWWSGGPAPGEPGASVIVGHVDSETGPAVFFRLRNLKPGAPVRVNRSDGSTATFTVDAVQTFSKDEFPSDQVYGATPVPTLRLITCGGRFDRRAGEYEDNVVVFASEEVAPA